MSAWFSNCAAAARSATTSSAAVLVTVCPVPLGSWQPTSGPPAPPGLRSIEPRQPCNRCCPSLRPNATSRTEEMDTPRKWRDMSRGTIDVGVALAQRRAMLLCAMLLLGCCHGQVPWTGGRSISYISLSLARARSALSVIYLSICMAGGRPEMDKLFLEGQLALKRGAELARSVPPAFCFAPPQ